MSTTVLATAQADPQYADRIGELISFTTRNGHPVIIFGDPDGVVVRPYEESHEYTLHVGETRRLRLQGVVRADVLQATVDVDGDQGFEAGRVYVLDLTLLRLTH